MLVRTKIRRRWYMILLGTVVGFAIMFTAAWFIGGQLIAPAQRSVGPPTNNSPYRQVRLTDELSGPFSGWYAPSTLKEATILLLHPIRANRLAMLDRAKLLLNAGYGVLLIDLQAHGENQGSQITFGHRESLNVKTACKWIARNNQNHRIGIVGWSLGGAAALLADGLDIDCLVLESVYPTIEAAVHNRIQRRLGPLSHGLAPALLMQIRPRLGIPCADLRPIEEAPKITCPVLVMCGELDEHTTLTESKRLYEAFPNGREIVIFPDAHHEDLLAQNAVLYESKLISFLADTLSH